ncbi:fructose-specific PTS transporter subunit EIIC [Metabacillus sp. GX 13764]|uniref:PTS fructose transporter subunit IIABC n=1 Tax=Metabacillus kandeliae TaxID=2900151 RepID=UPI001E39FFA1|nr:PTS fructose transporter subunit IIABC [Metabacillus kandeliae]MCD7032740.1 fructose-specific PTS transporter subunit EIIC [Metabacillus kandeliae]
MKITELLTKNTILLNLKAQSKTEAIDELVGKLDSAGKLSDSNAYKEAILAREAQSTTGIGEGIAIPHAKTSAVKVPAIAFGRSSAGVDYDSLDGQPSRLFFMIAAAEGANNAHLETLSKLSSLLMDPEFRAKLDTARTEDEVIQAIDEQEAQSEEEESTNVSSTASSKGYVLAVTACPTGIAHTYMAADSLKAKAKEMNVDMKVETNGSSGVKNELTDSDIANASAIIVAADKQVEMERFKGKHVIEVPVAQAIRKPEELIEKALNQDAKIYQGGSGAGAKEPSEKGQRTGFYKHLMNGVSNMLPFVVGGGILIAISFFWGIQSANPDDPSYNAFAAALKGIGGDNAFQLMIPVLAGFIAMSIADRPGLAPGMIGGFIALNGQAGFLGGLIAGFLAGYVALWVKKALSRLPQGLEGIKPVLLYPLITIFITGLVMMFVVNPPVAFIMNGLTDWLKGLGTGNLLLLGLLLGGMMAVDMGGPINKAAYTFGIAMISASNYAPITAIMAGGMVPPLGMALATTFFKRKFTQQEREAGKTAYVLGASFITEGAIPFAAADPGRVIPASVIGAAIAGALSMAFNISLPAPHGGVFVFWLLKWNALLYILAILIGSVVTALIAGFWKKEIK